MRHLLCAITGGVLAVLGLAGCAGDPLADAIAEVRAALPENESRNISDNQIIVIGRMMCDLGMTAEDPSLPPAYQDAAGVVTEHCDAWAAADPTPGDGVNPPISEGEPPAPIGPPANKSEAGAGVGAELSERGAWPMTVGETIDYFGDVAAAEPAQRVTVTAIEPVSLSTCESSTPGGDNPTNDRFVSVEMTVQNTPAYIDGASLGHGSWEFVGDDGRAYPDVDTLEAFYCAGSRAVQLPSDLGPARTYEVRTFMDLPAQGGWLILSGPDGNAYEYRVEGAG